MAFKNVKEVHQSFPSILLHKNEYSSVLCKIKVPKLNFSGLKSSKHQIGPIDFQTNLELIRFTNSFFQNLPKSQLMVSELKK